MKNPSAAQAVAVVTGASRGIGAATAQVLAARGFAVAVNYYQHEQAAADVVALITRSGGQALAVRADVADQPQVYRMVQEVLGRWGRLDALVNNAGRYQPVPVEAMTIDEWSRMLAVHLTGPFLCVRAALPWLRRSPQAAVVNVASTAALTGGTSGVHYAAAKGGVLAFTRALARELAPHGVRVNAVVPGKIRTDMLAGTAVEGDLDRVRESVPLRRLGTPEEVAEVIAFLASPLASFVTGTAVGVSGGYGTLAAD